MKKYLLFAALMALPFLYACNPFSDQSTNVDIDINNGQTQGGTEASPSPGVPQSCPDVVSVNTSVIGGGTVFPVGTQVTIDATPVRSGAELSPEAAKACNLQAGVAWSAPQAPCQLLTGNGPFNPLLYRNSVGECESTPTVQGVEGQAVVVTFQ